jgi:hypothetical protein
MIRTADVSRISVLAVSYACSLLSLESVERKGGGCLNNHIGSLTLSNRIIRRIMLFFVFSWALSNYRSCLFVF